MKASIGTIVDTEFGIGAVIAITKEWIIVDTKSGEIACYRPDGGVYIPISETTTPETSLTELDLPEGPQG